MSSFFRKALRLFVVLDDPEAKATESVPATAKPSSASPAASRPAPALSEEELSKYERHFEQLFESANLPGPDYFEFWRTMDALEAHIPNEVDRMKAAFASLAVQGLDKAKLISTAAQYRDMVAQDKANFESVVQRKATSEIAERQREEETLKQQNEERRRQIAQLQQEIDRTEERLVHLQREIEQEKQKIEQVQRGYVAAYESMIGKINADIERFQQIL